MAHPERGKGKMALVISTYRVSQSSHTEMGYTTAYMQHYRNQLKANISKTKPKQLALTDLSAFITQWKNANESSGVIVIMDANVDKEDSQFKNFLADTVLNAIITHFQPNLESQPTYRHGHKRLDYILVSDEALQLSTTAGHKSYVYPFVSDHRGVYMDISAELLFGAHLLDPTALSERKLQIDHPNTVNKYTAQLLKLYNKHKILS